MAASANQSLVDDLQTAFQNCVSVLTTQEYVNVVDQEEVRNSVDQAVQKFLEVSRQFECYFIQKRHVLSLQKPEQIVKEDLTELRTEIQRKDALLQKSYEKLQDWQARLSRPQTQPPAPPPAGAAMAATPTDGIQQQPPQSLPTRPQQHPIFQQHSGMPMMHPHQAAMMMGAQHDGFPQGPLAYLEQTTSSIGNPERR